MAPPPFEKTVHTLKNSAGANPDSQRSFSVRVPASTSNLGPGFDCFSLALQLYLTVTATPVPDGRPLCRVTNSGEGSDILSSTEDNLIYRAMSFVAEHEGWSLPPVQLDVRNDLPLGRGLGSSAAAIIAGLTLCPLICEQQLATETLLRYAFELEGHADNVTAAYYGGLIVSCVKPDGKVIAVKRSWPEALKIIVVSPDAMLKTAAARQALPTSLTRDDAVYNLQRVALFGAAIENGSYDLLWEAMQDRMHQPFRQSLVPGLTEALATKPQPGLVGVALSGSGPSVVALVLDNSQAIGESIANNFRKQGMPATVRMLEVDQDGRTVS